MTILNKQRLRQAIYDLVENDDTFLNPQKIQLPIMDSLVEAFLDGKLSVYFDPNTRNIRWATPQLYNSSESLDASISLFKRQVEIDSNSVIAHNALGTAFFEKGYSDQAEKEFRRAIEINSNFGLAHTNLGMVLAEKGLLDKALKENEIAVELDPNDGEARVNLGHILLANGFCDKAMREYKLALKLNPKLEYAYDGIGEIHVIQKNYDKAIHYFRRAVALNSNSEIAHHNLGRAYVEKELIDDGIKEFERAIELNPNKAEAYNDLGIAYSRKGSISRAIKAYKLAIKLQPNDPRFHANLGSAYFDKHLIDNAIKEYEFSLEHDPENAAILNNLGAAYAKNGRSEEAAEKFESALRINPDFEEAKANLNQVRKNFRKIQQKNMEPEFKIKNSTHFIRPDDPYGNKKKLIDLISNCEIFVHWIDKYFSKPGLDALYDAIEQTDPPEIEEIKILTSVDSVYDRSTKELRSQLKDRFIEFATSMKRKNIQAELRVLVDRKVASSIHGRWILTKDKFFVVPSTDTIARGQWDQIIESKEKCQIPFEVWWRNAFDIVDKWVNIEKSLERSK